MVSIGLGWLVAGRVLKPLRMMTAATRRISERSLHERLAMGGPDDELKGLVAAIAAAHSATLSLHPQPTGGMTVDVAFPHSLTPASRTEDVKATPQAVR